MALLAWTTETAAAPGRAAAFSYPDARRRYVAPARAIGADRRSLDSPAAQLFDQFRPGQSVVLGDVTVADLDDLHDIYGYFAEPAYRRGCPLTIVADSQPDQLDQAAFSEEEMGYAWTLQRLRRLLTLDAPDRHDAALLAPRVELDPEQRAAAAAHDGVVQVIAPAGSGKTTVLIERVRELLRRGVPPDRILCTTFNRDARIELQQRLATAGVGHVEAQTFHGIGYQFMRSERLLRHQQILTLSLGQWRRLLTLAQRAAGEHGSWIEPPLAQAMISDLKLGAMVSPDKYAELADPDNDEQQTLLHLYRLYEQHLAEQGRNDFDDLLLWTVRALRTDPEIRDRWQRKYTQVLVDEYQDIEPAQETLVQILAAPHDGLFCVGDEDQTLYGWRRASVERIVQLDHRYPGLQRVALARNYRCPTPVVDLSRRVIEHNRARFPKPIQSVNVRELPDDDRPVIQLTYPALEYAAADVARKLSHGRRGGLVCLARTTRLLRMIAAACVPLDVKISAPEAVFDARGARAAVEAYARLFSGLGRASAEDVITVCRHPGRGLPFDAEEQVAAWLRDGRSFTDTLTSLPAPDYARTRLARTGELFDRLARQADNAHRFLRILRTEGGLDEHFREYEQTFGGAEQVETETLDDLTELAAGKTLAQLAALLAEQTSKLKAIRDDENGVEITTVHRAKGRQWPTVIVFGCDEEQLPHKRSLEDAAAGLKDALEAERRVAYVAFTRAQQRLVILSTKGGESRFVGEAGFGITAPETGRLTGEDDFYRPWKMPRLAAQQAIRSGARPSDIMRSCRSLTDALNVLAHAVSQYDGADRRHRELGRQPVQELLSAIVGVGPTVSARILRAASIPPTATLRSLSDRQSNQLSATLRRAAEEPRVRETKPRKPHRRLA